MKFFRFRLREVNTVLIDCELIPENVAFELDELTEPDEAVEFFHEVRSGHSLHVIGFPDGEVSIAIIAEDEQSYPIAILSLVTTEDGKAWTVRLSGDFAETCSKLQGEIWTTLPQRLDDEEGLFGERSGRIALTKLAAAFAALEP